MISDGDIIFFHCFRARKMDEGPLLLSYQMFGPLSLTRLFLHQSYPTLWVSSFFFYPAGRSPLTSSLAVLSFECLGGAQPIGIVGRVKEKMGPLISVLILYCPCLEKCGCHDMLPRFSAPSRLLMGYNTVLEHIPGDTSK